MKPREYWIYKGSQVWSSPELAGPDQIKDLVHVVEARFGDCEQCCSYDCACSCHTGSEPVEK
jgi:hypothetical protein